MSPTEFERQFTDYNLPLHGVRLPSFEIDAKIKESIGVETAADSYTVLHALCKEGFKKLKLNPESEQYEIYGKRVRHELSIIKELEFVDYILLVWDVINYCRQNNIPVGMGRGSAAGSLVLFLIGVTAIDPIKHGLYFERFISKIRAKKHVVDGVTYLDGSLMCDIDMDICYYNRSKVLHYLEQRFAGRTCKILTLNTLQGKLLIKECGKIIAGITEDEAREAANMIPEIFGKVRDIEIAHDGEKKENGEWKYEPVKEFQEWVAKHPDAYKVALKLRNLIKNKSVHASAMLLSYEPIDESIPVELSSSKEAVSSFDMNWATVTNVKLDLLGLRAVSVVEETCKMVGIKATEINLDDEKIYQHLQDLKTPHGLFQIEADTVCKALNKIKPKNLEQLSGVMAVARPGAMQFIDQYALYTTTGTKQSIHPFFDDTLGETGGLALYQEQLMKMAHQIGFTLDEAEIIRRVVGKKKVDEVKQWKSKIKEKIAEQKLPSEVGDILWKILDDSANYSFNKSHSIAYAALAALTVYLKFNHPKEFFLALLRMTRHEPDPIGEISKIQKEFDLFNFKLLPPHITLSELDFCLQNDDIRFGLLSIKGIADKSIEKLRGFRHKYSTKFEIFQGAQESHLPLGILCALIQAGALQDEVSINNQSRTRVVLEAQLWSLMTDREKKYAFELGKQMNFDLVTVLKEMTKKADEKGKPIIKPSRFETIKRKYAPYLKIYDQNRKMEEFTNWWYERNLLGYTYNRSLREIFRRFNPDLTPIREVKAKQDEIVTFIGIVKEAASGVSQKKKTKYFKCIVADETDSITCLLFDTKWGAKIEECRELNGSLPKEDNIVIVKGTRKEDAVFGELISTQDKKVYTKLKELKSAQDKEPVVESTPESVEKELITV
jgi:DNA-directed DNA polymerase III PolC